MSRARNWCFTINHGASEGWKATSPEEIKYIIWQLEMAPKTGRIHIQGYVQIKRVVSLKQVKEIIGEGHFEVARGSLEDNQRYCTKIESQIGGPFEWGTPTKQGQRTDLDRLYEMIKGGAKDYELLEEMPGTYMRNYRAVDRVRAILDKRATAYFRKIKCWLLYGEAGKGKSSLPAKLYGYENIFSVSANKDGVIWWDGYEGEEVIVLEDFAGEVPWTELLRLLDGHPYRAWIKCSYAWAKYVKIYITSNISPDQWYPSKGFPYALRRRINGGILRF